MEDVISGPKQQEMEKISVHEFLKGFNQSVHAAETPNYLFSTAFVTENPDLMQVVAPAFDWVNE